MKRLIDVYELDPIEVTGSEPLQFRIEIFANEDGKFSARVMRWESMRLRTSFAVNPASEARIEADHYILLIDDTFDLDRLTANNPVEALNVVLSKIEYIIGSGDK